MNRRLLALVLAGALLLLCGCASLYEAEYAYAVPYTEQNAAADSGAGTEVRSYSQLKSVINAMVNAMQTEGELRFSNYSGSVTDDMAAACYEIKTQTPMGAYAIEELTYELSRIVSYHTAQVHLRYRYTPEEMARVVSINGVTALQSYLSTAVSRYEQQILLRVYSSIVNEEYIREIIERTALSDPMLVAIFPGQRVECYPREGVNRIYDIRLDYGYTPEELEERSGQLQEALGQDRGEPPGEEPAQLALGAARYLSETCTNRKISGKKCCAYDALVEQDSDPLGIALGYMALCQQINVPCRVVKGNIGAMGMEEHYWNIIQLEDGFYHVDVSRMAEAGEQSVFLMSDETAWGSYTWDYEAYPTCNGPLSYETLFADPGGGGREDQPSGGGELSTGEPLHSAPISPPADGN